MTYYESEYYGGDISLSVVEDAYPHYINWCAEHNITYDDIAEQVDVYGFEGLPNGTRDHILYHAEIDGFQFEVH